MGLLDEAIREHLELKRRRGVDPTEIAREEHEALEPIFPDVEPAATVDGVHADPVETRAADAEELYAEQPAPEQPVEAPAATLGEETVEIDMQAVLEADAIAAEQRPQASSEPVPAPAQEEGFEWEQPAPVGPDAESPPEPIPGQERLSFE